MPVTNSLFSPPSPSLSPSTHQTPTASFSNLSTKNLLLSPFAPLALALTLNSSLPSLAIPPPVSQTAPTLPPTTPYSQSKNFQIGLENGKIRPCPSINPGCVSTNPKSSSFAFPWMIPESASENAAERLREAILKTQKNPKIQVNEETPDGQYLQAEVDGGFGRDVMEFLIKRDVVSYRSMAIKVTYIYPFTTALGDSKGQTERMNKIREELGWYAPSFESMDQPMQSSAEDFMEQLSMCVLIFFATNGETYFNTAALVSCVQNFPKNRGPIVGILKGFAGLSGAILTQIYAMIHAPDHAALIFMVAVGPSMVVMTLMFIVRPVRGHRQVRSYDDSSFMFIYSVCLLLAAYLMSVMLLEDLIDLSQIVITGFTIMLLFLLLVPIVIPLLLTIYTDPTSPEQEPLLPDAQKEETTKVGLTREPSDFILSEVEEEKPKEMDLLPASERQKRIAQLQAKLVQAAAKGAVRVKRRRGPHRGEDFTLMQALIKADFWLMFISLLLGSGSGLTVIDNLGQMSQSLGYKGTHIFVSMISIWNFLGRIAGGYFSEIIVRDHAYPRPVAMAVAQVLMAIGHFLFAMAWPGTMYTGTLLIGLGFGAHWAIVPAAASELFGLRNFGALYNFLTVANPAGSLIFSGFIASRIYDYEAEKQAGLHLNSEFSMFSRVGDGGKHVLTEEPLRCEGAICFYLSSLIMSGLCAIAVILSIILIRRTKRVYANLYGSSRPPLQ